MFEFLRHLGRFLNSMDARAMTSLGVSAALLVFVILMFAYGQQWLHLDQEGKLTGLLARAANSPWALVGVISVYVLLALTGFPQILLFTATVLTFGPATGALYAWIATMASATFTFFLGHMLGGSWARRLGGERAQSMIDFLGRHGIMASGIIRVVPSAPFIVVNAAAGAAHIPLWKYWAGTGVGIIPKIALVAAIGALAPDQSILREGVHAVVAFFQSREPRDLALMALIIPAWLAFLLLMRRAYIRMRRKDGE
ncbi:TVP38/TMEM64 family protein [Amphiplicatus metriothermophilus]|uniref:TVP38/TMEM64 family membrane protein n=1 Tax=Amphiplicatus metriothermophilus TaxID=1519374 RepID=A0A239PQY8_9PROT|nr:VTT domain-containing protein [Amphiplicatus metriothermophilus]MBB5518370.1 putative membrane protein YdjX (TVP38/TMEM64 family) [Amphiplicatus metriothermophilus]SNT72463.1 Uncharacterized membrane protein YdjX, TVP38/TMEM64 family, SNARE-associated domain [Amphiplicatus metriothermophilus]